MFHPRRADEISSLIMRRAISSKWKSLDKSPCLYPSAHAPNASNPHAASLLDDFTRCCYDRDLPRAMKALHLMQRHQIWADPVSYSELIKCCLASNSVREAKQVHQHVFSNGYEPKTFLINIFINMYVKFGMLKDAEKMFDEMHDRNVVSWTTMISAYASSNIRDKAFEYLILMLRDGVSPNMYTYSSVLRASGELFRLIQIHCSIIKVGLESDVFVRSALIDNYAKGGDLQSAWNVFNEMVTKDFVVWNSIIGAFAQNSEGDEALNLYKNMKRAGFHADQSTLTSVLRACTALALLELGRQVHIHVLKYGQDLILNNALLDMYCKCGSLEDANLVFGRMEERDVISWSTMIAGLAQNGHSREAMELFNKMKLSGIRPNYITMVGVLFACSHAGLVEEGWCYFQSMKDDYGIDPGREHYGCMIDLLGRAGKLNEALELVREMECEPDAVTWRALLGASRVHRNVELAQYAAEQILKFDPEDAGTYILLSNIYANSQRWDDVRQIRRSMRVKGVTKEPGCSWIEVDKKIHAFIVGDESHPQIAEVNRCLSQLSHRLVAMGYVPDTNFVLQDLEGEQREDSLLHHSEKLAIVFGLMSMPREKTIMIRKNLRICVDCHVFAKFVAKVEQRRIVIRDPIRYHHFEDGDCSCGDYW